MGVGGELSSDRTRDTAQIDALRMGIDLGMTFIDTAEVYGNGHSEELVGQAVRGIREKVFIATKFSPENNGYENVLRAAEGSLRRLGTAVIDLYQVHWPNPAIPIGETMRALEKLVHDGKVRHVGVSNFSVSEMKAAMSALSGLQLDSNQVEYNLFDRFIESHVLPYCTANEISIVAYSPLDKGRMAAGNRLLTEMGRRYGKTPAQIVLNWLIHEQGVIVIPKATNIGHLRENAAAADFELDADDVRSIGEAYRSDPLLLPVDEINVSLHGEGSRRVYQDLEQALRNDLNFSPSPSELASDILKGEPVKPVRVVEAKAGTRRYDLIEGRIRYWAWVIAYDGKRSIPALIRPSR
jgi:diketogulonate reductase-like aldo/keto reductase